MYGLHQVIASCSRHQYTKHELPYLSHPTLRRCMSGTSRHCQQPQCRWPSAPTRTPNPVIVMWHTELIAHARSGNSVTHQTNSKFESNYPFWYTPRHNNIAAILKEFFAVPNELIQVKSCRLLCVHDSSPKPLNGFRLNLVFAV
jgi:hypothetical protein